ncbi:MAG: ferritin family protein [Chloroflexi bacterium]|nr:ferritin family protein [Chloroflexota bacterium]
MIEEVVNAKAVLKRAMQVEQAGYEFYLKAAETTRDEKGQAIFRTLASDEQNHLRLIKRQHEALTSESRWLSSAEIKPVPIDLGKPLFPEGSAALKKIIKTKSRDSDALLFGLDIESRSFEMYRRAALGTADALGKAMFEFLAGEEKGHFGILMMRYEYLVGPIGWSA